jgi:D-sedoheptulose 7-phosphate isomerase
MNSKDMAGSSIMQNFLEAQKTLADFISEDKNFKKMEEAGAMMVRTIRQGGKLISCGNGGSMCDAMHFAEELSGKFRSDRPALPAVSISDVSHISCVGNDYGYDQVFSRYLEALGTKGDLLLAISSSGNSRNVIQAMHTARAKGMQIVALTGKDGGKMSPLADVEIRAPHSEFADRAQEIHIKIIHSLIHYVELSLFA